MATQDDVCLTLALMDVAPCADCIGTRWHKMKICTLGMKGHDPIEVGFTQAIDADRRARHGVNLGPVPGGIDHAGENLGLLRR
jgi:hypothetical protein